MPRWPDRTPLERVLEKITPDGACLVWTSALDSHGYGQFTIDGRTVLAYRAIYEVFVGPVTAGLTLDHLCRNRACVNPAHLEPVTMRENTLRGMSFAAANARKTHCPQGHPYDQTNTYRSSTRPNVRICRECGRTRDRRRSRAKAAA